MAMTPNKSEIRNMSNGGDSDWEILTIVIQSGMEYPDAVWYVSSALNMDQEQREQMERDYDECC